MKIAAAYIRVSTDDQIEYSPDSQIRAIRSYAEKNGYYLPEQYIFMDEGISGRTVGKREGFKQMIALAKSVPKPFEAILVWKYSRFARNREDSVVYKSMLRKQCGIDVVSISESTGDDKMSILFEAMIEAMDEYYSINLSEEVKRGMTEKAKRGGVLSVAPFGYKVVDGQYEIVESEAVIIREAFSDFLAGSGFLTIAKKCNALGVKTHRGGCIENRTIEYWLHNPTYIGKTRWNPTGRTRRDYYNENVIISDGTHEPIVNDDLWTAVQQKLREEKTRYKSNMRAPVKGMSHWLNGVFRCGMCGGVMGNCGGFYRCSKKGRGTCESNGGISARTIAQIVIDKLEEILDSDDVCVKFASSIKVKKDDGVSNTLRLLQVKLEEANRRFERVKQAYESGIDTIEEYKENKQKISKEISEIKNLIAEEENQKQEETPEKQNCDTTKLKEEIKKVSDILKSDDVSNEEKNSVLKSIIKEIVKTGEDGRTFNIIFWDPYRVE